MFLIFWALYLSEVVAWSKIPTGDGWSLSLAEGRITNYFGIGINRELRSIFKIKAIKDAGKMSFDGTFGDK